MRAAEVASADFPTLLEPIDDLPPATMITSVQRVKGQLLVKGVSQDNGDVAAVTVNGAPARILSAHAGVVDWEIALDQPRDGKLTARATDLSGNVEVTGHTIEALARLESKRR